MTVASEEHRDFVFVSTDVRSAFRRCKRRELFRALQRLCPDLEMLARAMYNRTGQHVLVSSGEPSSLVSQVLGLDEGCPLSPAFFALILAGPLEHIASELQKLHAKAEIVAYLDDMYMWVPRTSLPAAMQIITQTLQSIGLDLNATKTRL